MVAKPVTVGVVGVIVLASALVLNYFVLPGEESETATTATAPSVPVPAPPKKPDAARKPAESPSSRSAPSSASSAATAERDAPSTPSFDVVRVDPDGNTVIAGRGAANTEIAIVDGDREIGRVTTDNRGEWVFVPPSKLAPGQRILTLKELDADPVESSEAVVLVIPEKGKDIAGRPTDESSVPLAMVVQRDSAGDGQRASARVLQAPAAGPLESAGTAAGAPGTADAPAGAAPAAPDLAASGSTAAPSTAAGPGAVAAASGSGPQASGQGAADGSAAATVERPASVAAPGATAEPAAAPPPQAAAVAPVVSAYPEAGPAAPTDATAKQEEVAVDVIDYDDKGEVVFSGRADPGSRVEVFIDDRKVGDAGVDSEGRWTMRPAEPVAPGSYQLRVDKVAPTGTVEARVAFPFVRADPLTELPNDRLVVIQPGNNLWRIATRVYGSGVRYVEIFDANKDQILDPDLIYPGQVFGLPRVN